MPHSKPHCTNDIVRACKRNPDKVALEMGDRHLIVRAIEGGADRGYMAVPNHGNHEFAKGTDCAITRWFKHLGILLVLGFMACVVLAYLSGF